MPNPAPHLSNIALALDSNLVGFNSSYVAAMQNAISAAVIS
jgi:hypothetical protein